MESQNENVHEENKKSIFHFLRFYACYILCGVHVLVYVHAKMCMYEILIGLSLIQDDFYVLSENLAKLC